MQKYKFEQHIKVIFITAVIFVKDSISAKVCLLQATKNPSEYKKEY